MLVVLTRSLFFQGVDLASDWTSGGIDTPERKRTSHRLLPLPSSAIKGYIYLSPIPTHWRRPYFLLLANRGSPSSRLSKTALHSPPPSKPKSLLSLASQRAEILRFTPWDHPNTEALYPRKYIYDIALAR